MHGCEKFQTYKQRGEWVELLFMAAAAEHGYHVLKPCGDSLEYDAAVEHTGNLIRVQVKSSTARKGYGYLCRLRHGGLGEQRYDADKVDLFAIYVVLQITEIVQFWGIICGPVGFLQPVPGSSKTFMRTRILPFIVSTLVILCFSFTKQSCSQTSARTLARSLDQLIEESDVIVRGSVVSSKFEPHPQLKNLMTVVVTMTVKETYKGKAGKTLAFREYAWNANGGKSSEYRTGQDLVLLLRPTSQYGLRSPAGLEQGRFRVVPDNNRHLTAVNGRANIGLFDHLEQNARAQRLPLSAHLTTVVRNHQLGPLLLTDLEEAIRTFARSH